MSDHRLQPVRDTGWTGMIVALVDLLRWPVALVVTAVVFRQPLHLLIDAFARALRP